MGVLTSETEDTVDKHLVFDKGRTFIFENTWRSATDVDDIPLKEMISLSLKGWLVDTETLIFPPSLDEMAFAILVSVVVTSTISFPFTAKIFADTPDPLVLELSNFKIWFTLYPVPPSLILKDSIEPDDVDTISILCSFSILFLIKLFSDEESNNLYGKVFLFKFELLKSNVWSISSKFSFCGDE